ncbi:cytochrome c biogenesis protein CcdA [Desulfallas sp. Bu1-1]|uniref:cytochrome c biogenesis CcdA family protein n=1 Tax=Desulfallas sp. Bu1-1 TaxID=2787620 RepID=UPI0018A0E9B7|nr:cytochrome c biogenesis protein CcdA [Desulfallas sp. Bu1-1]MBF7084487.1 cytochrome c biogenesis protein CcdA [Desulfallas sp. Bu1-1]
MENASAVNSGIAFLFGLLSFLSPCVLPLLPGYLSFIAGTNIAGQSVPSRRRALWNSTGFVLGFSVLFIAMGAAASGVGQWLVRNQELLMRAAGVIIIIFGLHISELLPVRIFYREARWHPGKGLPGWPGAFVFGLSFAAGWTPCVGPVLTTILLLAGSSETMKQGVLLLVFYSLGLAIPFVLAALGIGWIHRRLAGLTRVLPYANAISGGLLIAMGILLLAGLWNRLVLLFY